MNEIEELANIFCKAGGEFKNVRLDYCEESGFYCHVLDSEQEALVFCPSNMLVDCDDIDVNSAGLFIKSPNQYMDNIEFLEKYFSFHFNKKLIDFFSSKKRFIDSLSSKDKSLISNILPVHLYELDGISELEYAKNQIFNSHSVNYFGKNMIMPFVTFLNHDKRGVPYNINKEGISVSGKFDGEVFAYYNDYDTMMFAGGYGFVTDTGTAYSIPVMFQLPNGKQLAINRRPKNSVETQHGYSRPLVHKGAKSINVSYLPLFCESDKMLPMKIIKLVAFEIGISPNMLFDMVKNLNIKALKPVATQLGESKNQYFEMMASAAKKQLEYIDN